MGLFSALSGKIYKFNSINTPMSNELDSKIFGLSDTPSQNIIRRGFFLAQQMILIMFHPDEGMFRTSISDLNSNKLKNIWNTIIIWDVSSNDREYNADKLIESCSVVLGLEKRKIEILLEMFKGEDNTKKNMQLWIMICAQISEDADSSDNFSTFKSIIDYISEE
ncbi:MAG: hypothetical protein HOE19_03525 [Candidatus Komeilibacteria bacterium]|jgi:hypothetical protein|nr:hypothetical protein [Candidatus Komeilibacteria bacterium]MBT4447746.1 hypothetical protein [Candidatus Komeilibacteria bacterium]